MPDETTDRRGLFRSLFQGVGRVAAESTAVFESLESLAGFDDEEDEAPARAPERSPASSRTVSSADALTTAHELGLLARDKELGAAIRASIRLTPEPEGGGVIAVVGGKPMLPASADWPEWEGRRLTFLGQVDFEELPGAVTSFPADARLLFFFETNTKPSGWEAGHGGSGVALLVERDAAPKWVGNGRRAHASLETVIPRVWSQSVEDLDLADPERLAWEETRAQLAEVQGTDLTDDAPPDQIIHRLFGYPDNTGGSMPLICELVENGYDVPDHPFTHGAAERFSDRAARWELLAQFSADEEFGWSWGDEAERLYFWIDRDALAAGDLSGVRAIIC